MKCSVSLSVFEATPGMPVLYSGATEENIKEISELGYDGVDLFVSDPHSEDTKNAVKLLNKYNLGVGVVMPAALAKEGLFLGHKDEKVREEAVRRIGEIVEFTSTVNGMVSLGLVRGNVDEDETLDEFYARYIDSCKKMLEIASPLGVDILIEPINRYEINTINSAREGVDFIKQSGLPLYLMLDTFHMNIEDINIAEMLMEALPLTKHIHFLDSNRWAPGMGHIGMETLYRALEHAGYDGYLCLEALPKPTREICAKEGMAFFNKMRNK